MARIASRSTLPAAPYPATTPEARHPRSTCRARPLRGRWPSPSRAARLRAAWCFAMIQTLNATRSGQPRPLFREHTSAKTPHPPRRPFPPNPLRVRPRPRPRESKSGEGRRFPCSVCTRCQFDLAAEISLVYTHLVVFKEIKKFVGFYRQLPRYREIFLTFFKYGLVDLVKFVHLQKLLEIADRQLSSKNEELHRKPTAERFRMALEELGPTFVKFGQILSSRRDVINEAFDIELRKLQNAVTPFPGADAVKILETELGRK